MTTFMYKKVCITNRHLISGDFLAVIERVAVSDTDIIILREKDLSESEYETLAAQVIEICNCHQKLCVLHSFTDAAIRLNHPHIHLTIQALKELDDDRKAFFKTLGASTHSVDEAILAQSLEATYITASHIFPTDCKADLAPRGLSFLKEVCNAVDIPVYALGGVTPANMNLCFEQGAQGICMMSWHVKNTPAR